MKDFDVCMNIIDREVDLFLDKFLEYRERKIQQNMFHYKSEEIEIVVNCISTYPPRLIELYDKKKLTISERNFRCPSICRIEIFDESLWGKGFFSSIVDAMLSVDDIDLVIVSEISNHLFHRHLRESERWEYMFQYNNVINHKHIKHSARFLLNNSDVYSKVLRSLNFPANSRYSSKASQYRVLLSEASNAPVGDEVLDNSRKKLFSPLTELGLYETLLADSNDNNLCLSGISHVMDWNALYTFKKSKSN